MNCCLPTTPPCALCSCTTWVGWTSAATQHPEPGETAAPSLCMFACEAVGGEPEQALPAAAALELIHNFSLIHDDIQDGDLQRHHRPTVWAVWGKPPALQAGNVMRVLAGMGLHRLLGGRVEPDVVAACCRALNDACLGMIEGQYLDMDFEGRRDVDTSAYLEMVARKTGALIRSAMQMGSLVGNAGSESVRAMTLCGHYLGLAFQIRDDYLGVWGREEETGKPIGNDLRRKKSSLPMVYALERAGGSEREQLQSIYAKEQVDDGDVASMMAALEELGVADYVQRLAERQAVLALGGPGRPGNHGGGAGGAAAADGLPDDSSAIASLNAIVRN